LLNDLQAMLATNIRKVNERVWEWGVIDKKVSMPRSLNLIYVVKLIYIFFKLIIILIETKKQLILYKKTLNVYFQIRGKTVKVNEYE
jgi:hypothetical protein